MSMKKNSPKAQEKNKKGRLSAKAMSFHGRVAEEMVGILPRTRTVPEIISGRVSSVGVHPEALTRPKLTKLLLNVTVQRSLGPVQVLISPESTVGDLIAAALRQYSKEGRRPIFPSLDPSGFGLHYSQFSLESLKPEDKLIELGSRNFFLCPKQPVVAGAGVGSSAPSTCSKEADTAGKGVGWLRFMEFLL